MPGSLWGLPCTVDPMGDSEQDAGEGAIRIVRGSLTHPGPCRPLEGRDMRHAEDGESDTRRDGDRPSRRRGLGDTDPPRLVPLNGEVRDIRDACVRGPPVSRDAGAYDGGLQRPASPRERPACGALGVSVADARFRFGRNRAWATVGVARRLT